LGIGVVKPSLKPILSPWGGFALMEEAVMPP